MSTTLNTKEDHVVCVALLFVDLYFDLARPALFHLIETDGENWEINK